MGLIFSTLMLGLMATLSPVTIVVFILVLGTTRARVNAAAFLIGWGASLVVVFTASYLLGSSRSAQQGSGRTGVLVLEVLLGGALLVTGVGRWRRRAELSANAGGWGSQMMARTADLGPRGAVLVGVLKQPWAITTAAAVVVVHYQEPRVVTLIAFACFTVASTASVGRDVCLLHAASRRGPGIPGRAARPRDRFGAGGVCCRGSSGRGVPGARQLPRPEVLTRDRRAVELAQTTQTPASALYVEFASAEAAL